MSTLKIDEYIADFDKSCIKDFDSYIKDLCISVIEDKTRYTYEKIIQVMRNIETIELDIKHAEKFFNLKEDLYEMYYYEMLNRKLCMFNELLVILRTTIPLKK